jgi:hypothetical protein
MENNVNKSSEEFLLEVYRDCWNMLNSDELAEYLDNYMVYNSQWVFAPLEGKTSFLEYFNEKLKTIKDSAESLTLSAEIKMCGNYFGEQNKPGLIITQISSSSIVEVALFIQVREGIINRIDLCEAELFVFHSKQ